MQFKSIKTPLIIMLCAITLVPLMVLWGVVTAQSAKMVGTATDESMALAYADLDHILGGVMSMLALRRDAGDE